MNCNIPGCLEKPIVTTVMAELQKDINEQLFCEVHAKQFMANYHSLAYAHASKRYREMDELPFEIELVVLNSPELSDEHCVYLRHMGGGERFFLVVGAVEAWALVYNLKHEPSPRPLTHQALGDTIVALGGRLQDVLVNSFNEKAKCYVAKLRIQQAGRQVLIDVRPSDALNTAVVNEVPILILGEVINKAYEID